MLWLTPSLNTLPSGKAGDLLEASPIGLCCHFPPNFFCGRNTALKLTPSFLTNFPIDVGLHVCGAYSSFVESPKGCFWLFYCLHSKTPENLGVNL